DEMVRGHLCGRAYAGELGALQGVDRLARGEVHQVHRLAGVGRERELALDAEALAERRPPAETELRRDAPGVDVPAARQRRLLTVQCERAAGDRVVLERAVDQCRRRDR